MQGAWGPSLSRLLAAFRMAPNEPLVCLSAGVALLHHGMSRKVSDRLKALLAAVAFLQRYASLRGMNQARLLRPHAHVWSNASRPSSSRSFLLQ